MAHVLSISQATKLGDWGNRALSLGWQIHFVSRHIPWPQQDEGVVNLGITMGLGKEERGQCPIPIPPKAGDAPFVTWSMECLGMATQAVGPNPGASTSSGTHCSCCSLQSFQPIIQSRQWCYFLYKLGMSYSITCGEGLGVPDAAREFQYCGILWPAPPTNSPGDSISFQFGRTIVQSVHGFRGGPWVARGGARASLQATLFMPSWWLPAHGVHESLEVIGLGW